MGHWGIRRGAATWRRIATAAIGTLSAALLLGACTYNPQSGLLDIDRHAMRQAIAETIGSSPAELQQAFDDSPEVEHFNAVRVTQRMAARDGLSSNRAMTRHLQAVANKLARGITTADGRPFKVVLLRNNAINAYTPGSGTIILNEGLLGFINTEGQAAAVIAHEAAHVVMRHPQRVRQLALISRASQRFVDTITPVDLKDSMAPALKRKSLSVINGMMRDQEIEADSIGIDLMVAAGYDPREMVSVLRELGRRVPQLPARQNAIVGNHPLSSERESAAFAKIRKQYPDVSGVVNTRRFAELLRPYQQVQDAKQPEPAEKISPTSDP